VKNSSPVLPRPLVIAIVTLVSLVWAANIVVGFFAPDRSNASVSAVFAMIIGTTLTLGRKGSPDQSAVAAARRRIAAIIAGEQLANPSPPPQPAIPTEPATGPGAAPKDETT
jgi:hypothetical protein